VISFDFTAPLQYLPELLSGILTTIWVTLLSFLFSVLIGTVFGVARYFRTSRITYAISTVYVEALRNVPALVVIFFVYFGLPQLGIIFPSYVAGVLTMSLVGSAYVAEAIRGGMNAVGAGQWEAGRSLAMGRVPMLLRIALPQAFDNVWPVLSNILMIILFGTSLLSIVDIRELTMVISLINYKTYRTLEVYVWAMAIYLVLGILMQIGFRRLHLLIFPVRVRGAR